MCFVNEDLPCTAASWSFKLDFFFKRAFYFTKIY